MNLKSRRKRQIIEYQTAEYAASKGNITVDEL
jgi:hypothetical protein